MFVNNSSTTRGVLWGLVGVMAATRFHHADSTFALPDASWAVFFLAGLYLHNARAFLLLLAEAFLIDYLAIRYGGVSGWCVTPAYGFLIPTYAALWGAGKWCARFRPFRLSAMAGITVALIGATTLAFLISNASFYLFSGRFAELDWLRYGLNVAHYYPEYLGSALLYTGFALGLHGLLALKPRLRSRQA